MATTGTTRPQADVGRLFYLGWALIMAAIIVAGFSQTVPEDFAPKPGLPLLLHVHGAVFTAWVALMVAQPALVSAGDVRRHRQLGVAGAVLAGAMVIMGVAATLFSIGHHRVPTFFPKGVFLAMNLLAVTAFGGLVAAAIRLRRRSDWHKRLMMCASASILGPGLGRFLPMDSFGLFAPLVLFAVNDVILLIGPAADLVVRRRIHPAYAWGVAAVVLMEVAIGPLAFSPMAAAAVKALGG
ncbi:MAG: hypothetical protein IIZ63_00595 [Caulobacteraceae bacterium]|nr:hypothetical protein [Caulobacteraceae bacterium]